MSPQASSAILRRRGLIRISSFGVLLVYIVPRISTLSFNPQFYIQISIKVFFQLLISSQALLILQTITIYYFCLISILASIPLSYYSFFYSLALAFGSFVITSIFLLQSQQTTTTSIVPSHQSSSTSSLLFLCFCLLVSISSTTTISLQVQREIRTILYFTQDIIACIYIGFVVCF